MCGLLAWPAALLTRRYIGQYELQASPRLTGGAGSKSERLAFDRIHPVTNMPLPKGLVMPAPGTHTPNSKHTPRSASHVMGDRAPEPVLEDTPGPGSPTMYGCTSALAIEFGLLCQVSTIYRLSSSGAGPVCSGIQLSVRRANASFRHGTRNLNCKGRSAASGTR